jgi:hypothetical protein
VREVINGGTVNVGVDRSEVQSGQVERAKISCEASKVLLAPRLTNESAGLVLRGRPPRAVPQITLYGSSPIIELKGSGTLIVERVDKLGERYVIPIGPQQLAHGAFFDFAANGKFLVAGGVYGATWRTNQVIFRIDPDAKPGRMPIVARLLRLEPAS